MTQENFVPHNLRLQFHRMLEYCFTVNFFPNSWSGQGGAAGGRAVLRAGGEAAAGLGGPHHHRVVRVGGEATRVSSEGRLAERLERQDDHTVRRMVERDELERAGQRQRGPGLHRGGQHLHSHVRRGTQT